MMVLLLMIACGTKTEAVGGDSAAATDTSSDRDTGQEPGGLAPGESYTTFVESDVGRVAIRVLLPETPRYADGAGVVVNVDTFFTTPAGFRSTHEFSSIGLIQIQYLWPGTVWSPAPDSDDSDVVVASDGEWDHGGSDSIAALRDVLRFAAGATTDVDGKRLDELSQVTPLYDNVGVFAFSHPGIAAINVLSIHQESLTDIAYLVNRENPTMDALCTVEVGHWGSDNEPLYNPYYDPETGYRPDGLELDYSQIWWSPDYDDGSDNIGRPFWDENNNEQWDEGEFVLGFRIPEMYDRRFYSTELLTQLRERGALEEAHWPPFLATPEQAAELWDFRSSLHRYPSLDPNLKVMLVFAENDHVQPSLDKPHVRHAWDGLRYGANLWVRLNPDQAYISWVDDTIQVRDASANQAPEDWATDAVQWGIPNQMKGEHSEWAAVAEMADRVYVGDWSDNLTETLVSYPSPLQ